MSQKDDKYLICKRIDEQRRLIGLPADEFIALMIPIVLCFFLGSLVAGFFLGFVSWMMIKHIKKGQGSAWFLNLIYWYLPSSILRGFLMITPASDQQHWLG